MQADCVAYMHERFCKGRAASLRGVCRAWRDAVPGDARSYMGHYMDAKHLAAVLPCESPVSTQWWLYAAAHGDKQAFFVLLSGARWGVPPEVTQNFCSVAANHRNDVEVVLIAKRWNLRCDPGVAAAYAGFGDWYAVSRLIYAGAPVTGRAFTVAAHYGHTHVMRRLYLHGVACRVPDLVRAACRGGSTEALEWICDTFHVFPSVPGAYAEAISNDRLHVVSWLHAHPHVGGPLRQQDIDLAYACSNARIIAWIQFHETLS